MREECEEKYSMDVMGGGGYGERDWSVEDSLQFDIEKKIRYVEGCWLKCMKVDGSGQYVLGEYEKGYRNRDGSDGSEDIKEEGEKLLVLRSFDKDLKKVDRVGVWMNGGEGSGQGCGGLGVLGKKEL